MNKTEELELVEAGNEELQEAGYVGIERMMEMVFSDPNCRPCKRTVEDWMSRGWLPYIKIKRKVFFDPAECRRAIDRQFKVKASN